MDGNARMHRHRRLPRLEADGSDRDALGPRRAHGHATPVAGDNIAVGISGRELNLKPFGRAVGVARGAANGARLAQHVPGLQGLSQFELDAVILDLAAEREAELRLRLVPVGAEGEAVAL